MKREIKFRVWDKTKKEMCIVLEMTWPLPDNPGFSELMQFTGLLDRNNKEIYCGDIVDIDYIDCPSCHETTKHRSKVKFNSFGATVLQNTLLFHYLPDKVEVIGDIYKNPELLKNK